MTSFLCPAFSRGDSRLQMNRKGVEFTVSQVDEDCWNWRFQIGQIGQTVRTGSTQTRLMGMAAHRVQQKIDRELKEARDLTSK